MMKVCVLGCKSFPPGKWAGGIETNVYEVVSRLKGHVEFHVLARQSSPVKGVKVYDVPYLDFRLTRTPTHNALSIARAKRLIEREGIDFVHAHESFAGMAARIIKRLTGTPYILTMHAIDSDQPEWRALRKPLSAIERFAVGGADMLTCPGPLIRKRVISELGADPKTAKVVPNGVDVGRYGRIDRRTAKKKMNAPENLIIFTGRLTESKGLFPLLDAMKELKNHALWIVGSGPLEGPLKGVAPRNVKFLGFRRDIPELLAASDIFVLPSVSEGQPISLIEAMAAGVPVIASAVGEIPSVVGHDGLLIKPGSAGGIASAVRKLEDNRRLWARLAGRAKRRARTEYDWDVVAEKFYGIYKGMKNLNR